MANATIRPARPADRQQIRQLFGDPEHSYVRVPLGNIDQILSSRLILVATHEADVKGVIVSIWPYVPIAWLDAIAFKAEAGADETVRVLLDGFEAHLRTIGSRYIYCSMDQGAHQVVRQTLRAWGLQVTDGFLRLQKTGFAVPWFDRSHVVITSATRRDIPELSRIEDACFEPPWRDSESRLRRAMRQSPFFRVAFVDGAIAGFEHSKVDSDGMAQFVHLAVDPQFRGINVGKALLADAIRFFEGQRARAIEARTERNNLAAQRLFASFGFRPHGPHRDVLTRRIQPLW